MTEGEYESACAVNAIVPNFVPKAVAWGKYLEGDSEVYFFLGDYHDMGLSSVPEPNNFISKPAQLHTKSKSPAGMFGFHVPAALGKFPRAVKWENSWATCFTNQLQDVIAYDNQTNGLWLEYDAVCKQLIGAVIPRLLGALQSAGRNIEPVLIHGDLWEKNTGTDKHTEETILFDPGSTYAHNEMEFGTWRCSWAHHFTAPVYTQLYQR
jgi:protein-ribulosamine 3-kinase